MHEYLPNEHAFPSALWPDDVDDDYEVYLFWPSLRVQEPSSLDSVYQLHGPVLPAFVFDYERDDEWRSLDSFVSSPASSTTSIADVHTAVPISDGGIGYSKIFNMGFALSQFTHSFDRALDMIRVIFQKPRSTVYGGTELGSARTGTGEHAHWGLSAAPLPAVPLPLCQLFLSRPRPSPMSQRKKTNANGQTSEEAKTAAALQQYNDTDGHFSLVRNFRLADLVTIMNGVCGSFSIFSSGRYMLTNDDFYLKLALAFPLAGLFFDFLDGKVARWRKSSSLLGQELDSLADLVSFGVAPAFLAFAVGLRTHLDTVALAVFICCGLARLARFNATVALVPKDATGKAHYFEGLPIPSSLALVALLSYWTQKGWIAGREGVPGGVIQLWGSEGGSGEIHLVSFLFSFLAAAMVSKTLRVRKL
ncbi:hypothetical protein EVG20_g2600 [Dentipellis fragilis]|uniref:CDP-diacylglycerol--serine O-phosphatidyltransferase n=1 Tax=Dentipellis fragilis TaxID=205917 RepID=A0A4Y9Z8G3_9AGAM|nr:hypothetical protein EVG20_g2600 [Dentipellis fragilis]